MMMMKASSTLPFILISLFDGALAFSNPTPLQANPSINSIGGERSIYYRSDKSPRLLPLSVSATANIGDGDDVMRQFKKKEIELQNQREKAAQKLEAYNQSLSKLQASKAQYEAGAQVKDVLPSGGAFSETTLRSAVKAFCWRIIAGSITFVTTLQFSGSTQVAMKVVAGDFFSKSLTMFIGERLMNKSQAGRAPGGDNVGRSVAKALIWRLFAVSNTLCMAVFVAKDLSIAGKIASTDAVFKTALMFFYERVWARITWGKEYLMEYSI